MDGKKERQIITVFYNDTSGTVAKLVGEMIGNLKGIFVTLKVPRQRNQVHIPLSKIIRIEEGDLR